MLGRSVGRRLIAGLFLVTAVSVLTAASSSAQTYVGVTPPNVGTVDSGPIVLGVQFRPGQLASGQAAQLGSTVRTQAVQPRAQASRLAVTGGDLLGLLALAAGAVTVGAVLVRSGRRTRLVDASSD